MHVGGEQGRQEMSPIDLNKAREHRIERERRYGASRSEVYVPFACDKRHMPFSEPYQSNREKTGRINDRRLLSTRNLM